MTLEEYRERVEALARARQGEPVFNGSVEHAAVIVENMFFHSNERVRILTGKLNPRAYGPDKVMEEVKLFLAEPKHKLEILIEEADKVSLVVNPFYAFVSKFENCQIRVVSNEVQSAYDFHFLVMDNDSYRFEADKGDCQAVAAFGDAKGAKNLGRIFDALWKEPSSTPYSAQ